MLGAFRYQPLPLAICDRRSGRGNEAGWDTSRRETIRFLSFSRTGLPAQLDEFELQTDFTEGIVGLDDEFA